MHQFGQSLKALIWVLPLASLSNFAANAQTGAELRSRCEVGIRWLETGEGGGNAATEAGFCLGYFQGAIEGISFAQDLDAHHRGASEKIICLPRAVSMKQIAKAYIKVVGRDAELMAMDEAAALGQALKKAFPCN